MPQLLANTDRRPQWQFRVVGDGRDPAGCVPHHGRIERYDSAFWKANNPANCANPTCRCTIRAYSLDEVAVLRLQGP